MFQYYPKINYKLNNKTYPVVDVLKRVRIKPSSLGPLSLEQDIIDTNMRPDTVSSMLYSTSFYDWTVLHSSGIKNPSSDWVINSQVFNSYIQQKYPDEVIILDDDYNSKQNLVTQIEQVQRDSSSKLKIELFTNNLLKFYDDRTSVENELINSFWDNDKLSTILSFLDYMHDDFSDYLQDLIDDIETAYAGITNGNIVFFIREIKRFRDYLIIEAASFQNYYGQAGFFIPNEKIKGADSGATAIVKHFNVNTLELFIKSRNGTFVDGERILGEQSFSMFNYKDDTLKDEYLGSYNATSAEAVSELNYYSFEFDPIMLMNVGDKCVFGNNEFFHIETLHGSSNRKLKYNNITLLPQVGEIFVNTNTNTNGKIVENGTMHYLDYDSVSYSISDTVIISDIVVADDPQQNITDFDSHIVSYGAISRDNNILDVEGIGNVQQPVLAKIGSTYGIITIGSIVSTIPSQSGLYTETYKSFLDYEVERNSDNQTITYFKPEVVEAYIQEYIKLLGG